jgi:hypothetical protein
VTAAQSPELQKQIRIALTAKRIEAFSGAYLSPRYDNPQPTPQFHRECWERYCSNHPACATAAPRSHAKSTALTHDYILANVCFRIESYIILVGASEEKAIEHLQDISNELHENEDLIRDFHIKSFIQDTKSDIIVECTDGHQFRIVARGAEQKIRGTKWRGRRPGLIVGDDLEDDEQVENKDRRKKFRRWFFRACKQALRRGGRIRVHGTILHQDSLLMRLMRNRSWNSKCYRAHKAFQDFSEILWPEQFPEARLRAIRQEFIDEGDSAGYSQEYLNDPHDNDDQYLRSEWFLPMNEADREYFKRYRVGVDFAASVANSANRTCFFVNGKDTANINHIVDIRVGRMSSLEIIGSESRDESAPDYVEGEFFSIWKRWGPDLVFSVEKGKEWLVMKPMLLKVMQKRDIALEFEEFTPVSDKKTRGQPMKRRMKAGMTRWDTEASWFPEAREEMLLFTGDAEAMLDDIFDAGATSFIAWENAVDPENDDAMTEEEEAFEAEAERLRSNDHGRSVVTGY